jgi:hypothetical protein
MKLIDDLILRRYFQRAISLPVKVIERNPGSVMIGLVRPVRQGTPDIPAGNQPGIGIHEDNGLIKPVAFLGIEGPVYTKSILKVLIVKAENNHGIDSTDPILGGKLEFCEWCRLTATVKNEGAASTGRCIDREIQTTRDMRNSEWKGFTGSNTEATDCICGKNVDAINHEAFSAGCCGSSSKAEYIVKYR